MTRLDFGFALFEYTLSVFACGAISLMFLRWYDKGWPRAEKWWAYPVMFTSSGLLVVIVAIRFVQFVRAF